MNILDFNVKDGLDINDLIKNKNPKVYEFLNNEFVYKQSTKEWGKIASSAVEHVVKELLNNFFGDTYSKVVGDVGQGDGHDILTSNNDRVQCKLKGVYNADKIFSAGVSLETTRRHTKKNENKIVNGGHVGYGSNEFDYIWMTIIHIQSTKGKVTPIKDQWKLRTDMNSWNFCLIDVSEITDPEREGMLVGKVSPDILNRSLK